MGPDQNELSRLSNAALTIDYKFSPSAGAMIGSDRTVCHGDGGMVPVGDFGPDRPAAAECGRPDGRSDG